MTAMELLTAVRIGVPLVVIVMADGFLNRIRLQQFASSGSSHGVELLNPDFAAFAESVGAVHEVIGRDPEVSFRRALRNRGVTLLEVRLGDTMAVHRSRLRGTARGIKRGPMVRSLVRWVAGKTRG
jgi:thiamine pyrophosphate-dependent acetolactate synthase large subunit-like protein